MCFAVGGYQSPLPWKDVLPYSSPVPNFRHLWAREILWGDIGPLPESATLLGPLGEAWPLVEGSKLPTWTLSFCSFKYNTLCYSWRKGLPSRRLLSVSIANMKHQLHMLLFLLGLLLICIIIRKLLPIPNEQRGFKHLHLRENRWFISYWEERLTYAEHIVLSFVKL